MRISIMKMNVILIAIMIVLQFPELTYSQATILYEDSTAQNNWSNDLIVDKDGNIIYVGIYCYENNDYLYGYIAKISPDGERLCDYITPDNQIKSLRFESVNITDRGTFIVTGGEESNEECGIAIMEFDNNLELLWYKCYPIIDYYAAVHRHRVIEVGDGNYIGTFAANLIENNTPLGKNYMFKFNSNGELLKLEQDHISPEVFKSPSDIIMLDDDLIMIAGPKVFLVINKELEIVDTIWQTESVPYIPPSGVVNFFEVAVGCRMLANGKMFCVSGNITLKDRSTEGLMFMELDEDSTRGDKFVVLNSRSIVNPPNNRVYRSFPSEKRPMDLTSEENIIIGGTLNCYTSLSEGSFIPYMTKSSLLCVASFDSDMNINWEQYYEDEHSYYMMALRATEDGGVVVATIKAREDSVYEHERGNIVIFKFDSPVGVRDVYSDNLFSVYPNPATNILTINVEIGDCAVHFYDTMGKLCRSVAVDGGTQNVDISDMVKGLYLVNAIVDGKIISNQKLMIR